MLMNNSDVNLVRQYFSTDKYSITAIICKRVINSKNPKAQANEVIIKNY